MLSSDQKWRKKRRKEIGEYLICIRHVLHLHVVFFFILIIPWSMCSYPQIYSQVSMAEVSETEPGGEVCSDCTVHAQSKPGSRGTIFLQILNAAENAMWSPNHFRSAPWDSTSQSLLLFFTVITWGALANRMWAKQCGPRKIPTWNWSCSFHLLGGWNEHNHQVMTGNHVLKRAEWDDRRLDLWVST